MVSGIGSMAFGGATMLGGGLMSSKGRAPGIAPQQQESAYRKLAAGKTLHGMFEERAKDPYKYVMPLQEQQYYDKRRDEIYGEGRERQAQGIMGRLNRSGILGSGATGEALGRFGQQTLRDKQQFYFQDRATRLQ